MYDPSKYDPAKKDPSKLDLSFFAVDHDIVMPSATGKYQDSDSIVDVEGVQKGVQEMGVKSGKKIADIDKMSIPPSVAAGVMTLTSPDAISQMESVMREMGYTDSQILGYRERLLVLREKVLQQQAEALQGAE